MSSFRAKISSYNCLPIFLHLQATKPNDLKLTMAENYSPKNLIISNLLYLQFRILHVIWDRAKNYILLRTRPGIRATVLLFGEKIIIMRSLISRRKKRQKSRNWIVGVLSRGISCSHFVNLRRVLSPH